MKSIHLSVTTEVDLSADAAWELISNCRLDTEWRQGVVSMTQHPAGPLREGSVFVEILTLMGQRMSTQASVVTLDPGTSFHWVAQKGADVEGHRSVQALTEGRSQVELGLTFRPSTFIERAFKPVFAVVLRRNLAKDAKRLRSYATDHLSQLADVA
jgi:uncharacterized membrane protein